MKLMLKAHIKQALAPDFFETIYQFFKQDSRFASSDILVTGEWFFRPINQTPYQIGLCLNHRENGLHPLFYAVRRRTAATEGFLLTELFDNIQDLCNQIVEGSFNLLPELADMMVAFNDLANTRQR